MSRYIDADALKPDYYDEYVFGDDEYVVRYYSETQIDNAPSIDIVRCKECYMCDEEMWCSFYDSIMESDDYCSYGERKSDE